MQDYQGESQEMLEVWEKRSLKQFSKSGDSLKICDDKFEMRLNVFFFFPVMFNFLNAGVKWVKIIFNQQNLSFVLFCFLFPWKYGERKQKQSYITRVNSDVI